MGPSGAELSGGANAKSTAKTDRSSARAIVIVVAVRAMAQLNPARARHTVASGEGIDGRCVAAIAAPQPTSLLAIRNPAIQTPMPVPMLVSMKFNTTRATRLRYQPLSVCASSRKAMKSP